MKFDCSHIQRYLRLQGTSEEDVLPFAGPPIVIANVISLPEPIWKTAVATLLALGAPNVFARWRWQSPLFSRVAMDLLPSVRSAVVEVERAESVTYPEELVEETQPEPAQVLSALRALRELLSLAVETNRAVETWAE